MLLFGAPKKFMFSPYQLDTNATPEEMIASLQKQNYTKALSIALGLGMPIRKILKKIPQSVIQKVVAQLGEEFRSQLIIELGEN